MLKQNIVFLAQHSVENNLECFSITLTKTYYLCIINILLLKFCPCLYEGFHVRKKNMLNLIFLLDLWLWC